MHQERHENTRPKWQGYVGTGGREACKMKFRIGSRVIRAEESQGASLDSVRTYTYTLYVYNTYIV